MVLLEDHHHHVLHHLITITITKIIEIYNMDHHLLLQKPSLSITTSTIIIIIIKIHFQLNPKDR
jgi:hypothetical protein